MRLCCGVALLVFLALPACATAPLPSKAAFSDQILAPLAEKRAADMIEQWKADARLRVVKNAGGWNLDLLSLGADYLVPGSGTVLRSLKGDPQTQLNEYLAWLEARRLPLGKKLLAIYDSRIQEVNAGLILFQDAGHVFSICVDGKERRYDRRPGFPRLDDGPGPCPTVEVLPNE